MTSFYKEVPLNFITDESPYRHYFLTKDADKNTEAINWAIFSSGHELHHFLKNHPEIKKCQVTEREQIIFDLSLRLSHSLGPPMINLDQEALKESLRTQPENIAFILSPALILMKSSFQLHEAEDDEAISDFYYYLINSYCQTTEVHLVSELTYLSAQVLQDDAPTLLALEHILYQDRELAELESVIGELIQLGIITDFKFF